MDSERSVFDERPLLVPLIAVIAGICCAGVLSFYLPNTIIAPLAAVTFLSIFLKNRLPFFLFLALLLAATANLSVKPFLHPDLQPNHISRFASDNQLVVEGVIDSRPEATETGSKLYLRVEQVVLDRRSARATGRLLLFIKEGNSGFMTGDRVRFASRIDKPRNYGLPGEFDYAAYLACRSVYATAFAKHSPDVILIRQAADYRLQRRIDLLASRIGTFIDAMVPATEAAILRALLIGDMGKVPRVIKDAYSRTGVNHILSISGFHVGIIALFVFQLMMAAARRSEFLLLHFNLRRFILLLTLPLVVFYLFLSGAAPATTRSVIMIGFYVLALMLEREADPVNSLMLAALFLLALSPQGLFDISFQLSFLALWGIIVLTPLFMTPFESIQAVIPRKLLLFLMASSAATVATAFPVAFYFHRVSATGLLSNFFIVPLMGYGAVVIGFSALPFFPFAPIVARPLMAVAAFLVKVSNAIIMILTKIPTLPFHDVSRIDLLLFYLLLASITFIAQRRMRILCCGTLACACLGSLTFQPGEGKRHLTVTMFSIGQAESTLITFPDGKTMLVDGGGNVHEGGRDVGERLLAPALWRMGVRRIDWMVLTHPHPDHLQGLKYVAANFEVGEFWEGSRIDSTDYNDLHRILSQRQVPVRRMTGSSPAIAAGGARIELLSPVSDHISTSEAEDGDLNDQSLVFRLVLGEFSMLFTGDIGVGSEERLTLHPEQLKCSVLKVPHHGSRFSSSSAFLAAAAPEFALISAGYHNSFHLPARQTLDSLHRLHATVYRTDLDGTIQVTTDSEGNNLTCGPLPGHFH